MINDLDQQAQDEITKNRCYKLQAILQRMIKNIKLINASPNSYVITVVNTNLFDLALQYYGNVDYWVTIAEANLLTSNWVTTEKTIVIPPKPTTNPGGVYVV